jgi:outer membrane receptor protein involved in Fe transport
VHKQIGSVIEDMSVDGENNYFVGNPGDAASGTAFRGNFASFAQDSWSLLDKVTLDVGLRLEKLQILGPDAAGPIEAVQTAPRTGKIYDWSRESRSKIYGSYGRFSESITVDLGAGGSGQGDHCLNARAGFVTPAVSVTNPNFGNPASHQQPFLSRFGGKITF